MAKAKRKSARADGRGGWVPGRRRNADVGDWQRLRIAMNTLINDRYLPGVRSARALADVLGVSDRTVRRWLKGEDRPAPEVQEMIRTWIGEQGRK